jgi:hypothetical protein
MSLPHTSSNGSNHCHPCGKCIIKYINGRSDGLHISVQSLVATDKHLPIKQAEKAGAPTDPPDTTSALHSLLERNPELIPNIINNDIPLVLHELYQAVQVVSKNTYGPEITWAEMYDTFTFEVFLASQITQIDLKHGHGPDMSNVDINDEWTKHNVSISFMILLKLLYIRKPITNRAQDLNTVMIHNFLYDDEMNEHDWKDIEMQMQRHNDALMSIPAKLEENIKLWQQGQSIQLVFAAWKNSASQVYYAFDALRHAQLHALLLKKRSVVHTSMIENLMLCTGMQINEEPHTHTPMFAYLPSIEDYLKKKKNKKFVNRQRRPPSNPHQQWNSKFLKSKKDIAQIRAAAIEPKQHNIILTICQYVFSLSAYGSSSMSGTITADMLVIILIRIHTELSCLCRSQESISVHHDLISHLWSAMLLCLIELRSRNCGDSWNHSMVSHAVMQVLSQIICGDLMPGTTAYINDITGMSPVIKSWLARLQLLSVFTLYHRAPTPAQKKKGAK